MRLSIQPAIPSVPGLLGAGAGAGRFVGETLTAPVRVLARLDRTFENLESIARGVDAMHGEFVGMRADIRTLNAHVEGLREEVRVVDGDLRKLIGHVAPIPIAIESLDKRVDELAQSLVSVRALADRVGRIGWRRAADKAPEPSQLEP